MPSSAWMAGRATPMVETSMASRKLAAQSSSNASPAPLRIWEVVIEIVPFYAAASVGGCGRQGTRKCTRFQPYCKLIVTMSGITDDDE